MCKKCSQQYSVGAAGVGDLLTQAAVVLGGYAAAGFVQKMFPGNDMIRIAAPLAGAWATSQFGIGGSMADGLAVGMAVRGVQSGVKTYLPAVADTVGIAGGDPMYKIPVGSVQVPGVAGGVSGGSNYMLG